MRVLALLLPAACEVAEPATSVTERDSAGIHIVESARPAWREGEAWRIAGAPSLEIGVQDGPEEYQFFRIAGAHRFDDGSLLVVNAGTGELRSYDPAGRFLRTVGRQGGGPGEFHRFSSMSLWAMDDTLRVGDNAQGRINLFDRHGRYLTTVAPEGAAGQPRPQPLDVFPDGSWLTFTYVGGGRLEGGIGTVIESDMAYARYDARGRRIGELFRSAGQPRWVHQFGGMVHYPYLPLTPAPQAAVVGDRVAQWAGPGPQLLLRDTAGEVRAIVRWRPARERTIAEVWDRFRTEDLARTQREDDRRLYEHYYAQDLPLPDTVPVVARLLADARGNLWARHYLMPWDDTIRWDVFEPTGRWLGDVVAPSGLRILEIGADYVLGRHRDDLGVERLRVYPLTIPAP